MPTSKKNYSLPDFSDSCPLCGGQNCCVHIGFYHRKSVLYNDEVYKNVPVARYLCKEKGEKTAKHKTFSLLPHMFIPYKRYCIDLMVNVVKEKQKAKSIEKVKDVIATKGEEAVELETRTIHECEALVEEAYNKLISFGGIKASIDIIDAVMTFGKSYKSKYHAIRIKMFTPFEALAYDYFYNFQQGPYTRRHFLFGTCSQKINSS